jgi:hypothetical protein
MSNNSNCGECGNVCTGGKQCTDGVCICTGGTTDCSGTCTNLNLDDKNCGACGNQCDPGQTCVGGRCACSDPGNIVCDGQCIDGLGNRNNCGKCGNQCPAGQDCIGGSCQPPCGPCEERVNNVCVPKDGLTNCNGACVNTQTDPNNCGGCGTVCDHSGSCQNGACTPCPDYPDLHYTWCPADLGGDIIGVCCRPETPNCCFTAHGGGCCADSETCCDGYCCPVGTHCCENTRHTYPCIPDGQQCPAP